MKRHPKASARGELQVRKHITSEAARIMAEEGVRDFQTAKRKATQRLNLPETKNLPTNQEIETALQEHIQLFHADLPDTLRALRKTAVEAMHFLAQFDPRLVGPVLSGTVTRYTEVQLHVTADSAEDVLFFLSDREIPFTQVDRRLRFGGDRFASFPAFRFHAGDIEVEVCVFSPRDARETPLSPVDGKPMRRVGTKEAEELLAATS